VTSDRPAEYLVSLVRELCKLPRETEWVEFKMKDAEPQTIGEYLSALANAAALTGKAFAYLVWGVRDKDHTVVGTAFAPRAARVGNEELENWLLRLLEPKIDSRICEERGSGIDKVVFQVELSQLPAPVFEAPEGFTRTVLFAHRPLTEMDKADRVRACYLHACLRYVTREPMTNASVRERFGIAEKNAATASRLLNEAVDAGLIVVQDPEAGTRIRRYLPFWAGPASKGEGVV